MSDVIDLKTWKIAKTKADNPKRVPTRPLQVKSTTGTVTGSTDDNAFGDKLIKIKNSLNKINNLMKELKEMSNEE